METQTVKFKAKELTVWQKIAQFTINIPKARMIEEFAFDGQNVTVKTKKGKTFTAPLTDTKVRIQEDQYNRKEFFLYHGEDKVIIKEVGWMLTDEEWDKVKEILESAPNTGETNMSKATKVLEKVKDTLEMFS